MQFSINLLSIPNQLSTIHHLPIAIEVDRIPRFDGRHFFFDEEHDGHLEVFFKMLCEHFYLMNALKYLHLFSSWCFVAFVIGNQVHLKF